jgi:hypothetical protein
MMNWKNMEGSDYGLFQNTIPVVAWRDQGKQRITTAKIVDILAKF